MLNKYGLFMNNTNCEYDNAIVLYMHVLKYAKQKQEN